VKYRYFDNIATPRFTGNRKPGQLLDENRNFVIDQMHVVRIGGRAKLFTQSAIFFGEMFG
jgi:hypothetical protein